MKYEFLESIRDKMTLFWMFAFPLFLMTILVSALPENDGDIAMRIGMSPSHPFAPYIESDDEFDLIKTDEYRELLQTGEIDGYIDRDGHLIVTKSGVKQKVAKQFADTLKRVEKDPDTTRKVMAGRFVKVSSESVAHKDSFFFSLLAMLAYMAAYSGVSAVEQMQANITPRALRFLVSPADRFKAVFHNFAVTMILQAANGTIAVLYAKYVLGRDFVVDIGGTYVIFLVASTLFYALGLMSVYLGPISSNARGAIVQTSMMLLSGGAGLYGTFFRASITRFLGRIADYNPVKVVTDAIYQINILGEQASMKRTLGTLVMVSGVLFVLATLKMRRNRYDSL